MTPVQAYARARCRTLGLDPDELIMTPDLTGRNAGQDNSNNYHARWMEFYEEAEQHTTDRTDTSVPDTRPTPLEIIIHTMPGCTFCERAKLFLADHNLPFTPIDHPDPQDRIQFYESTGTRSMPQIYIDGDLVGGYDKLISTGVASLERLRAG